MKESQLTKEQRLDLLMEKIKKGIKLSFEKFLERKHSQQRRISDNAQQQSSVGSRPRNKN